MNSRLTTRKSSWDLDNGILLSRAERLFIPAWNDNFAK